MVYTGYTREEFETLPERYKRQVIGIKEDDEIIQVPLCPNCGSELMECEGYLTCIHCASYFKVNIIRE